MSAVSWIKKIFQRRTRDTAQIPTGRVTEGVPTRFKTLSPHRSRVTNTLEELRKIPEQAQAVDFLKKVNPDVSMSVWNFVRLANLGNEMRFYDTNNKESRVTELENDWRDFASRINEVSNAGLDGLVDILHQMAFMRGGQGLEVEVSSDRTEIVDVHPIVPQTLHWEVEERKGRRVWIPYQYQFMQKVSLEPGQANFFWVPTDPDPDDPRGNLILAPVLQAVDFQLQILSDLQAVLHHQGWPKRDIKILMERAMQYMPAEVKASEEKQKKWLKDLWHEVRSTLRSLEPDDDLIHYDDIEIDMTQGATSGRSLDVRAIAELVDVQTLSGSKQMSIFMNRNQGITETWGSVQFMIFCNGIASIQRGSKRLIEEVARLWLRVKGVQAVPVFEHNKADWQSEEQKATVKLMWQEFWAIAQLMGWVDADKAAQEAADVEGAHSETPSEGVRVSFSSGGGIVGNQDNGQSKDGSLEAERVHEIIGV